MNTSTGLFSTSVKGFKVSSGKYFVTEYFVTLSSWRQCECVKEGMIFFFGFELLEKTLSVYCPEQLLLFVQILLTNEYLSKRNQLNLWKTEDYCDVWLCALLTPHIFCNFQEFSRFRLMRSQWPWNFSLDSITIQIWFFS